MIWISPIVEAQKFSMAIHGGAGRLLPRNFTEEKEAKYRAALDSALQLGYSMLRDSASALDVCEAVVSYLEDCPLFNAGRGSVYSHEGKHEMDAAIMDGKTLGAGAVAGISKIKNPVQGARQVMEESEHVLLAGRGAEKFLAQFDFEEKEPAYFHTDRRWQQLKRAKKREKVTLDHTGHGEKVPKRKAHKYGTVGCVALDAHGNLASATSTGGMTNKKYNRIGDSPLIGSGTYANNETVAVSCTGHGEYFIRSVAAFEMHALMKHKNWRLKRASNEVIQQVADLGGRGGLIAVDHKGRVSFAFNTDGMYRGSINHKEEKVVAIFSE